MEGYYSPPPQQNNGIQGLAIAGLVLGILSVIISFIPCIGLFSVVPGIVGIILCILSLVQSSQTRAPKGIAIAGLVCSIIGCCVAGAQFYFIKTASSQLHQSYERFEQSGGIDSLGRRIMTLEAISDSMQNEEDEQK